LGALTAPVVAGIAAVAAAGFLIFKYWDRLTSIFMGVGRAIGEQLAPAFDQIKPALEWLKPIGETIAQGWEKAKTALSNFSEWVGLFFGREVLNDQQKAAWENAGHDAATRMIEAIKSTFSELVAWAADLGSRIGEAISSRATAALNRVKNFFSFGGGSAPAPTQGPQIPARAKGGPLRAGQATLVGEEGPEIITASRSGYVHPNDSLGGLGGGITLRQTVNNHFNGVTDTREIIAKVSRAISDATRDAVRGLQVDYGLNIIG
jgi:hypothetical protein